MDKSSRPARVLMAVGKMDRGGMETMLMNLYRCIDRNRLQFDFLCTKPGSADFDEEILALGGRIFHTSLPKQAGSKRILEEMRKVMEEEGPFAAVHAHLLFFNGFVLLAAKRAGIPIRISHSHASSLLKYHSLKGKVYASFMRRLLLKNATCLLEAMGRTLSSISSTRRGTSISVISGFWRSKIRSISFDEMDLRYFPSL